MIRLAGHSVRGFALSAADNEDIDSIVARKLAEVGSPSVSAYQAANNLHVDGVAGHDTLTTMGYGYLFDLDGQGKLHQGQTQWPTKPTPLTPEEAAQAISVAYQTITGNAPTPEVLALLLAQSANETGNWQQISNYNFGGIKAVPSDTYVQAMVDGNPGNRHVHAFAAYPSVEEGAVRYVGLLRAHGREPWWEGLQSGDPEMFVNALVSIPGAHYFEAPTSRYLARVQAGVARFADLARAYARPLSASESPIHWAPFHVPTPPLYWPIPSQRATVGTGPAVGTALFMVSAVTLTVAVAYAVHRSKQSTDPRPIRRPTQGLPRALGRRRVS